MILEGKPASVVPKQYLGYSLQATRFVFHLLEAPPGSTVSLEVFEDVGVETPDGGQVAEQDKSVLSESGNPISDRSKELWKAFANWINAVECKQIDLVRAEFRIYVSSHRPGRIVQSFSDAHSLGEASRALSEAQSILWGPGPSFSRRSKVAASIQPYVDKVFRCDRSLSCEIIRRFTLTYGGGSPQTDLRSRMDRTVVPPEIIDDVLNHILGWVKRHTDLLLEQDKPAAISRDAFFLELTTFVRKHDRRTILTTFAPQPPKEEIKGQLPQTYVRQLEIVEFDEDQKLRAINDFLRSAVDRTQWAVKGYVHSSSFIEFEDSLIRAWGNYRDQTLLEMRSYTDEEKGRHLCIKCMLHTANLEGLAVPPHFVPGSFHTIANTQEIGWHPEYKSVLQTQRTE